VLSEGEGLFVEFKASTEKGFKIRTNRRIKNPEARENQ
jgi:hypothetical protein